MGNLKQKLIASFIALGLSAPAAFVAYDLTLPSEGLEQKVYILIVSLFSLMSELRISILNFNAWITLKLDSFSDSYL